MPIDYGCHSDFARAANWRCVDREATVANMGHVARNWDNSWSATSIDS